MRGTTCRTLLIALSLVAAAHTPAAAQHVHAAPAAATAAAVSAAASARAATRAGAERPRLQAVRTPSPPALDGRLDDAEWERAAVISSFVQTRPEPGEAASEHTEARVLFDDHAIYVGVRLHDRRADSIAAPLARRDQSVYSDWFSVGLDTYRDGRNAFVFAVNPRGVKRDIRIFNDGQEDLGWDAVWEAATRVDEHGWTAELRIPLSQLRFSGADATGEEPVWGINFTRQIARRDEVSHWAPTPPDASGVVSRYGELRGLVGLRSPRRLEMQPYSVARVTRAPGDPASPFHRPNDLSGSAGLDLKYGVTQDLTLTATLNPDFGQVEADPAVVNLTAFESFFQERRPFFSEGAEIFSAGSPQLFYSRRIGRAPRGPAPPGAHFVQRQSSTTILGAAKLTGRLAGGWSVGVLNAVTAEEAIRFASPAGEFGRSAAEPATSYSVARVTRDLRGGNTSLGTLLTATHRRLPEGVLAEILPANAYSAGLDFRHRFGGGDYQVQGALLGSHVLGSDSSIARLQRGAGHYFQRPDAEHLRYDPTRESLTGSGARLSVQKIGGGPWRWWSVASAFSPGFEINDLGYGFSADQVRQSSGVGYEQYRRGRTFQRWLVNVGQMSQWSFAGERYDAAVDLYGEAQLPNHWGGSLWYMRHSGGITATTLRGGPALHYPGRHMGSVGLYSDRRKPLRVSGSAYFEAEDDTGSGELQLSSTTTVRAANRLNLSLRPGLSWSVNSWQYVARRTVAAEDHYLLGRLGQTTASLTGRLDYTFSPTLSLQLYAQPFLSAGRYSDFRMAQDPRAAEFQRRFRTFAPGEISATERPAGGQTLAVDLDGDGAPEFSFADPSFNVREYRSNAVLRWEYRPGSSLFVVWSQSRSGFDPDGRLQLARDADRLFGAPGTNVLLIKLSYWVGL